MKRLALFVLLVSLIAPVAYAQKNADPFLDAVKRAADLQLARQGTYANGDTGTGTYDCAWEWVFDTGSAYENTQAPSARGLVAAFNVTGDARYLAGAQCAADRMVTRYDATTVRPYSEDVLFLVDMSQATGKPLYAERAATYHARTRGVYPTGAQLADRYLNFPRSSMAGWDLASQINAALAVGQKDYAKAIALRLVQRRADWEGRAYFDGYDYTELSHAALVGAFRQLQGQTFKSYYDEIVALTLKAQASDGSWSDGDYQVVAFALSGLAAAPPSSAVQAALLAGRNYLLTTETQGGGWSYGVWGEYVEVNGEVLSGLCALWRRAGLDKK